jgi:protein-S-isoprenylcysteine O-methyltransferase Ste14
MSRAATLLFAIICYAIFFATFLYLIIFVGDFAFATLTVDTGPGGAPLTAALIDIALIALFGIQHSVMARTGFKRAWTRILPAQAERSVYVLASSIVLMFLFLAWRPIDIIVWNVTSPALGDILWFGFWLGWLMVLVSTFLINLFVLFGLQQAWLNLRGREAEPPRLSQPSLYKWVRHPMMLGFFFAFWSTPQMTVGHLILALGMSAYILIALRYEERDLVGVFGKDYEQYRDEVGMLTPRFRRRSRHPAA